MHYYQHHIGDFIKDTSFLTNEEVGIYMKLIWLYYDTEKPLPKNIPLLTAKVNARGKQDIVQGILELFFYESVDYYCHVRCKQVIEDYHKQLEAASRAGKASAEKRKLNARSTPVQPTINHKPITINQTKTSSATKVACPAGVSLNIWNDYLTLRRSKKLPITETALSGIAREAEKAGITLQETIVICCERGWGGFKADWLKAETLTKGKDNQEWRTNDDAMVKKANELKIYTKGKTRFELIAAIDMKMREL
jgi:uncharacterized protein YdaU (DUF1376 family)